MIAWVVTYAWHNRSDRLFQTLLIAQTANRSLRCGGGRARNPSRPGGQHGLHLTGRIYACSRSTCELSHDIALAIPGGSIYAIFSHQVFVSEQEFLIDRARDIGQ